MNEVAISLISSILTVSLVGVAVFLFRAWIVERLKASIQHEYDLKKIRT